MTEGERGVYHKGAGVLCKGSGKAKTNKNTYKIIISLPKNKRHSFFGMLKIVYYFKT